MSSDFFLALWTIRDESGEWGQLYCVVINKIKDNLTHLWANGYVATYTVTYKNKNNLFNKYHFIFINWVYYSTSICFSVEKLIIYNFYITSQLNVLKLVKQEQLPLNKITKNLSCMSIWYLYKLLGRKCTKFTHLWFIQSSSIGEYRIFLLLLKTLKAARHLYRPFLCVAFYWMKVISGWAPVWYQYTLLWKPRLA